MNQIDQLEYRKRVFKLMTQEKEAERKMDYKKSTELIQQINELRLQDPECFKEMVNVFKTIDSVYTQNNVRKTIGSYTKGQGENECAIRDGVYCKPIDGNYKNGYLSDVYIVDFWGNIFHHNKNVQELKMVSDEQFIRAKKAGFRCVRNLADSEIFAAKGVIDKIIFIHRLAST